MYSYLPLADIERYMPEIIKLNVSTVARSPNQFLSQYKRYGTNLPYKWAVKRENFIKRHLAQYKENPTLRRKLALITWAYLPK